MKNIFDGVNSLRETLTKKIEVGTEIPYEIPDEMPEEFSNNSNRESFEATPFASVKSFQLRQAFTKVGMIGFVSWRWVDPFIHFINSRKCLEIMSGKGWLSHALRSKGVNVIATDNYSWHENYEGWKDNLNTLTDIENIDAVDAIEKYGADVDIVICSWPEPNETAFKALRKLNEINPNAVFVFIGEVNAETCADMDFHKHYNKIKDEKFEVAAKMYQSWFGFPDQLLLGTFRENK